MGLMSQAGCGMLDALKMSFRFIRGWVLCLPSFRCLSVNHSAWALTCLSSYLSSASLPT